jgi:16S rRNA (guanine527-N7)-methyltransferase
MVSPPLPEPTAETLEEFRDLLNGAAGRAGRPLLPGQIEGMIAHFRILLKWGRRMNLTGLRDVRAIVRRHFAEPLQTADLIGDAGTLLDLGSGNGFPAIPLALMHEGLRLILVESSHRKSEFLRAALREVGLREAMVETRRVRRRADLDDLLPVDFLTFRAVRGGELLAGNGKPLLRAGGRLLAFVSRSDAEDLKRHPIAGLRWSGERALDSAENSVVAVLEAGD